MLLYNCFFVLKTDPILWRYVFCISAAIYVAADILYVIFASGEVQPWNYEIEKIETNETKEKKLKEEVF